MTISKKACELGMLWLKGERSDILAAVLIDGPLALEVFGWLSRSGAGDAWEYYFWLQDHASRQ